MWISLMLCLLLPVTLLRPKAGLLVVVFLLPFMPRYLGIGIGEEGFALSPRRIAFIAFVSGLVVHAMFRADMLNRARMIVRSNQYFFTLIALVLLVRMVSTVVNSGLNMQLLYVLDDVIITLAPGAGVLLLVNSADDERRILVTLLAALFVSACIASVEAVKGGMILQGLVSVSVEEAGRSGLTDIFRGDAYRAKALFDNPLLLAEFACIVWPLGVYLYYAGVSQAQRLFALGACLAAPLTIALTHARSGWLVFLLGLAGFITLRGWDRSGSIARAPLVVAFVIACSGIGLFGFHIVDEALSTMGTGVEGARSIVERLNQYAVVASAMSESPLFGYGMSRNILTNLDSLDHIDNFWLRLLLEGGLLLLAAYLLLAIKTITMTFSSRSKAGSRNFRMFMSAALISILSFLAYKNFVSMPTNNSLLFLIAVLVMRRDFWNQTGSMYARTSMSQ